MAAPQAMVKGIQNTANQFMNNPQKVLQKAFYRLNFIENVFTNGLLDQNLKS